MSWIDMKSATFINILFVKTFNHIYKKNHLHLWSYRGSRGSLWWAHTSNHFGQRKKKTKCLRFSYLKCFLVNAENSCVFLGKNRDVFVIFLTENCVGHFKIDFWTTTFPSRIPPLPCRGSGWLGGLTGLQFLPHLFCSVAWVLLLHAVAIKWIAFPHCSRKMVENFWVLSNVLQFTAGK